jgi:glycosyltransferase involved in cell wall biosynthesis
VPVIERSLRQVDILRTADEIWADSPTNAQELLDRGFDPMRVHVIPLVVEDPRTARLADKPTAPVNILYVGRIAPAKGLHDLIPAVAQARLLRGEVRVTIAGNTTWTDPAYLARLRESIVRHGLADVVHFVGRIDDAERERLLHTAHILVVPSYHEGFCRPVVEGLRAGCVPLVYDAYNLPHIAAGLGRVVPTGDIGALAAAMRELVHALPAALAHPMEALLRLDRGQTSVVEFSDLAHRHTDDFTFETVGTQMRQRLLNHLGSVR